MVTVIWDRISRQRLSETRGTFNENKKCNLVRNLMILNTYTIYIYLLIESQNSWSKTKRTKGEIDKFKIIMGDFKYKSAFHSIPGKKEHVIVS